MGAEDALKTMECIPKPSAGSGQRHFLTEVKIRAGENMLRIKDLVRAVKRVCGLGHVQARRVVGMAFSNVQLYRS